MSHLLKKKKKLDLSCYVHAMLELNKEECCAKCQFADTYNAAKNRQLHVHNIAGTLGCVIFLLRS